MNAETEFSSWSRSLEDVARDRWGRSFRPRLEGLAFAPKLVREPRAYDKTPVVMLVASSASALLHRPLFDAVELLEKATGAFKVVVFTDCPASSGVRDFDWAVEHCMAEPVWDTVSTTNWLEMAGKRLIWASSVYKPALVVAAIDEETAVSEIRRLGKAFSIDDAVLEGAVAHLRVGLEALPTGEHPTLRGWMGNTTVGEESTHRILRTEYDQVGLRIARRPGRVTLITEDSEATSSLSAGASDHDWSVMSASGLEQLEPAARRRLLLTVNSAFADTLTFQVRTGPAADTDVLLTTGNILVDPGASRFELNIEAVGRRYLRSIDDLFGKLNAFSRADDIAQTLSI